jgi:hypothetical protein
MIRLVGISMVLITAGVAPAAFAADVSGSQDPLGIARFPYSWIVDYEKDDRYLPREYALGRVDRTRRDVRVEHEVRAPATREWATYEMPPGTVPEDVIEHYLNRIGSDALFSCRGLDCGRSNYWANNIFKQAILYGPDANQFYFAGKLGDALVALYVIERGSKRIYAHLEVLQPESQVAVRPNAEILARLAGNGVAVVDGVTPAKTGELSPAALELLGALAQDMHVLEGQTVYVVCHLYGSQDPEQLIERSRLCAQAAADALTGEKGPELVPFGAGPLLPRDGGAQSRVELVLPHRLSHHQL